MTELNSVEQEPPRIIKVADCYFYAAFIDELIQEMKEKVFLVKAGLDTASKSDQFAYSVLERLGYFSVVEDFTAPDEDKNDG